MLRLYALPVSTYCTRVRIVLRLKGVDFEDVPPTGGSYSSPAYRAHMPPGTIPAIEHDGFRLFDSEAIVEYLEDRFPEPALRSTDIRARARERAISHYHNTRIEPCVRRLFPLVKSPGPDTAQAVREALAQMGEQLQRLETVVSPDPFVSGANLRIPDCTFPATLFMGQDIFAHLGATLELPETIECWLQNTLTMPIVAEEVARNRAAVTAWLAGFSPAPTPGN